MIFPKKTKTSASEAELAALNANYASKTNPFATEDDNSGSNSGVFGGDITVSLSGGRTLGKYVNGDIIPSKGKTSEEVLRLIAVDDIAPTYVIPTLSISQTSTKGEVGAAYSNTITTIFTQNDAGNLSAIKIQKNGTDITPNGTTSPFVKSDSGVYVSGNITYQAIASYAAGAIKNYFPSGNADARTPQIRNPNAPQAGDANFQSGVLSLQGAYNIFYGDSSVAVTNSTGARALPNNRFTDAGNTWILNTGTVNNIFPIAMPATNSLLSVIDLDALNANITSSYTLTTFNVNDAGGTPVAYKCYTLTNGSAYSSSHRHQITIS